MHITYATDLSQNMTNYTNIQISIHNGSSQIYTNQTNNMLKNYFAT